MIGIGYGASWFFGQVAEAASRYELPAGSTPSGIEYSSVSQLGEAMARADGLTSATLVKQLQRRIASHDREGPSLHAIIELNPQALAIARERDHERASGKVRGPLHGIPVLLKDNIQTADRMQTSAGSPALVGLAASEDASVVSRLREEGAVILGKTNMSELAGFRGEHVPDGWSGRGGQTRNPHRLDADVGGSSSGSAAAVAAGFAPLAVGTETNGSIVVPAALNGIVGLKPSVGLLGRSGIIPASLNQDTPGPMARSVFDAALLLNAMAGSATDDPAGTGAPVGIDYTALLVPGVLKDKRIGYPVSFTQGEDSEAVENSPQFRATLEVLKAQGATLVPVNARVADAERYGEVLYADVKQQMNQYLANRQGLPVKSLAELIAFNERDDGTALHDQQVLKEIEASSLSDRERDQVWESVIQDFRGTVDELVVEHSLDVLVTDFATNNYFAVAAAGYPGISVPSGMDEAGVPTSAYFYGPRWSEDKLLAVAYGYEQASQAIRKPGFLPGTAEQ